MSGLYLIHAAKGSQKQGHKYIDRFWKNNRWNYIYKTESTGYSRQQAARIDHKPVKNVPVTVQREQNARVGHLSTGINSSIRIRMAEKSKMTSAEARARINKTPTKVGSSYATANTTSLAKRGAQINHTPTVYKKNTTPKVDMRPKKETPVITPTPKQQVTEEKTSTSKKGSSKKTKTEEEKAAEKAAKEAEKAKKAEEKAAAKSSSGRSSGGGSSKSSGSSSSSSKAKEETTTPAVEETKQEETKTETSEAEQRKAALKEKWSDKRKLSFGDTGNDVRDIHAQLRMLGMPVEADEETGEFGDATKEAIIKLQKENNLEETGVIDPETYELLEQLMAKLRHSDMKGKHHIVRRSEKMSDLYLIHSKKGSQKANHKYIDRIWKNGKWQYIYNHSATKLTKTTGGFNEGKKNNQKWVDISNKNGAGVTLYKGSNRDNKYTGISVGKPKDDYKYVEKTKKLGKYTYVYDNENGTSNLTVHKDHDTAKEAKKRSQAEAKRYKTQRKTAGVPNKIQDAINTAKIRSRKKK